MTQEMYGLVGFDHLKIKCIIGVLPHERTQEQDIYVDLRVEVDFAKVAFSDGLEDTLDYNKLATISQKLAIEGKFHMIETYAAIVLKHLHSTFELKSAWIRVKKPQALSSADYAVVELRM